MSQSRAPESLLPWALASLGVAREEPGPVLAPVAGDASSRRYYRATLAGERYVLAVAPPATEKNAAFLAVRELLDSAGIRVPALYAADLQRGYLLLEDLGDRPLLAALDPASVDGHYAGAFAILSRLAATAPAPGALPAYDAALLDEELGRFGEWFVEGLLGRRIGAGEKRMLQRLFALLIDSALVQPRVPVHRDFHSRNLMLTAAGELAVIDFQDAVHGPLTYDLVSLLRDCYIRWPAERVRAWALDYRRLLLGAGRADIPDGAVFLRWFDWMGLQRHLKVLGTFARLYLRDGKPGYLADLPLVIDYSLEVLDKYAPGEAVFGEVAHWYRRQLAPVVAGQDWSARG